MLEALSDRELLARLAQEEDSKAFRVLFLRYFPRLKYFIGGLLGDQIEAENLTQDIFLRIWQNRERFAEVQNFNAYLYRMAKNAVCNFVERTRLQESFLASQEDNPMCDESVTGKMIADELEQFITQCVEQMPTQRRTVFTMSRREGFSNEQIAQKLAISRRTVESHISAALADLRKVILSLPLFL